ncbi:hypothetical protein GH983_09305 [Agrobacterium sp. MA01]|uniref:hypothetical protein n=1 Tax=Agrobacterium sp. MA01 TaxID=2664893 RepID=UPI00129AAE26|nr:hypothetical protein [Agrobacterium sp. MA01]QGG90650.1 hypothetical protein GH983_09305 [Agrobacterium sp. MA01]
MSLFATEFPVKSSVDKAAFLSQVIAWLRGNNFSKVLDEFDSKDLDKSHAHIRSANHEELIFRELTDDGSNKAIGFRHDIPDDNGRLWRTEAVLRFSFPSNDLNLISFKTQCLAKWPTARTDVPKKPFLIKAIIGDSWQSSDKSLPVSDKPVWLSESEQDVLRAASIFQSTASKFLPIVYISAKKPNEWQLDRVAIEKLAYELGGVAHVVVEPSRGFSFKLRDATAGKNSYGGTIALVAPTYGTLRRFFSGGNDVDRFELSQSVRAAATSVRSQMPVLGWDWLNLQEACLIDQRNRERTRLTAEEIEYIYQEEIRTKDEKINDLENQLLERPITTTQGSGPGEEFLVSREFIELMSPEIYPNEISDRIRLAVQSCLKHADSDGLDKRSKHILEEIIKNSSYSDDVSELCNDLKRASRDPKRMTAEVSSLLLRHGYIEKSDNKHIRLEPVKGMGGLENITLSKTPGDKRGLENSRKQIEKILGINKF